MKFTGHQVQDGSASEVVEKAENPVAETSNDLEPNSEEPNKSTADTDRGAAVSMGDKTDSQATTDSLPPSPPGTKTMHSVATALDGTQVRCTGCGEREKSNS